MKRVFLLLFGLVAVVSAEQRQAAFDTDSPILRELAAFRADEKALPDDEIPEVSKPAKAGVSTFKAIGLSVLLPGSGHWYVGRRDRARVFFGIEAAGWTSFAGFLWFSKQRENDYQDFAAVHAGADPAGKNEQFWRSLTFYENRDDYNKIGRITNLDNPFYPEIPAYNWQWDSEPSRVFYRELRNSSKTARRRAMFTLAMLGVERLVAAADAYRIAEKISSKAKSGDLEVYFEPSSTGGRLILTRLF